MVLDCVCVVFSQLTLTSESATVFKKRSAKQCDITVLLIQTHDIDKFPKNENYGLEVIILQPHKP